MSIHCNANKRLGNCPAAGLEIQKVRLLAAGDELYKFLTQAELCLKTNSPKALAKHSEGIARALSFWEAAKRSE